MQTVLGMDAAWTLAQLSDMALVSDAGGAWRLIAIAPAYTSF